MISAEHHIEEEVKDSRPIRLTPIPETTEKEEIGEDKDGSVFSEVVEEIIGDPDSNKKNADHILEV